ncbi:hypothetical protein [Pseudoduganella chitinolytica]|uniref:Uncharacterized protein n=1 Tax=Pseudoduganella chitinolytica TaxID=34070 RepID=A0ABY8B8H2_9BURK|nr:hypothetical protein [Pseudoduganella chitinolytica]WEF32235.1 hypothetical protein PX653_22885 [Pseudoduganella chitinolytica]
MMKKPELPPVTTAPPSRPSAPAAVKAPRAPVKIEPRPASEDDRLGEPPPRYEPVVGAGDRAHHLALVAGTALPALRPSPARTGERLQALRPASRQACERRCGRAGQCDPASPFGCGGEFCLGFEGRLY